MSAEVFVYEYDGRTYLASAPLPPPPTLGWNFNNYWPKSSSPSVMIDEISARMAALERKVAQLEQVISAHQCPMFLPPPAPAPRLKRKQSSSLGLDETVWNHHRHPPPWATAATARQPTFVVKPSPPLLGLPPPPPGPWEAPNNGIEDGNASFGAPAQSPYTASFGAPPLPHTPQPQQFHTSMPGSGTWGAAQSTATPVAHAFAASPTGWSPNRSSFKWSQ